LTEPARQQQRDIRVGSSTNGLAPVSFAERSLAAEPMQWLALASIALSALAADQLTKYIVTSRLGLDDSVHVFGSFYIHHVQNSGIAFGLFSQATAVVILLTGAALLWMLVFFARSARRARPADRRQRLEPGRPRPARLRDRLPRPALVAGVQPRGQLHRRRRSPAARRARARRARAAAPAHA